jgi:hypothetical protein
MLESVVLRNFWEIGAKILVFKLAYRLASNSDVVEKSDLVLGQELLKATVVRWGQTVLLKEVSSYTILESLKTPCPINQSRVKRECQFILFAHCA